MPENDLYKLLQSLATERRNQRTRAIDLASSEEICRLMNAEDRTVADAVSGAIPQIAQVIDLVVASFQNDGRLIYVGAGTSGRLGILDASECPPTFGADPGQVVGVIAGGRDTVFLSKEGIEDDRAAAEQDVDAVGVTEHDTVVGIAASRRTPYVWSALACARTRGASTAFVTCNAGTGPDVDVTVTVETGPEAITGSTRLKAGTAQKMVLNMISTGSMVRLGKVYENLMVDLRPNSAKLIERGKGIIMALAGVEYDEASAIYQQADRDVKRAVVMARLGVDRDAADERLARAGGFLARALGEREGEREG